jgi:hypothetical protein
MPIFCAGLAGFDNPMRDAKTEEVKRHIGQVSVYVVYKVKRHIGQVSVYVVYKVKRHIGQVSVRCVQGQETHWSG